MKTKFYICPTCGNIICKIVDSGVTPECCGSPMDELLPKTKDSGLEKHLPVFERLDACTVEVRVGSIPHPTTEEHHIVFVAIETTSGIQIRELDYKNGLAPSAKFCCCTGHLKGIYSYCNLHGLWYKEVNEDDLQSCK